MPTYGIGNQIRITGTFTNPLNDDAVIDPDTVYCAVRSPASGTVSYQHGVGSEITKSSTGVYYIDVPLSRVGSWYIRWSALDSNLKAASADEVQIRCARTS